jgi:hypothetical protein
MSTYSSNLRIELPTDGTQAGTWGNTTNANMAYVMDTSIAGYQEVTVAATPYALTYTNGPSTTAASNESVYAMLKIISAPSAFSVYAPPNSKSYIIWNATGYTMTLRVSATIGSTTAKTGNVALTIAADTKVFVWSDGTSFYEIKSGNVTGTVAITNGGTGQVTSNAALNALLPSQTSNANKYLQTDGTNSSWDAISLSTADITGTLAVANGGTGSTTATGARTNLGLVIGTDVPGPSGTGASGTWGINVSGNAATATSATSATNATNATYATTAGNGGVTSVDSATAAVTLSSLAAFGRSLSQDGYQKLPGGLILQWGRAEAASAASSTATTVTFPLAFPSGCYIATASLSNYSNGAGIFGTSSLMISNVGSASFVINRSNNGNGDSFKTYYWFAIGV